MATDVVDLSGNVASFAGDVWIGTGRKYPTNPPPDLVAYCDDVLNIPYEHRLRFLPSDTLSVSHFLAYGLPLRSSTLVNYSATQCFSTIQPTEDLKCLLTRKVPSRDFIKEAKTAFSQSILNGARSFIDPNYKGGGLPLWVINFWEEVHEMLDAQERWRASVRWLGKHMDQSSRRGEMERCNNHLKVLGWNVPVAILGGYGTTMSFSRILADSMIEGHILDIMVLDLTQRIEANPQLTKTFEIVTLTFLDMLGKAYREQDHERFRYPEYLKRLEEKLKHEKKILLFPGHLLDTKHYIALSVDFQTQNIFYGDSLRHRGMPKPSSIYLMLDWWLWTRFGKQFGDLGCSMEHGRQQDGVSCAFTTINMLEHATVDEPLWNVSRAEYTRAIWFNRIVENHFVPNPVSLPSHNTPPAEIPNGVDSCMDIGGHSQESLVHTASSETRSLMLMSVSSMSSMDIGEIAENANPISTSSKRVEENYRMDLKLVDSRSSSLDESISPSKPVHPFFGITKDIISKSKARLSPRRISGRSGKSLGGKRTVEDVDSDISSVGSNNKQRKTPRLDARQSTNIGIGPSSIASRKLNDSLLDGSFVLNEKRWSNFQEKIRKIDPDAQFQREFPRVVRHSACGKDSRQKEAYNIANFKNHAENCKGSSKKSTPVSAAVQNIANMFQSSKPQKLTDRKFGIRTNNPPETQICQGLSSSNDSRIATYLNRSPAVGGGGPRLDVLADCLYPDRDYVNLSQDEKNTVRTSQRHHFLWRNEDDIGRVYSTSCKKEFCTPTHNPLSTCTECLSLLQNRNFRQALRRELPDNKKLKFTPKHWRNEKAVAKWGYITGLKPIMEAYKKNPRAPCLLYASGVIDGDFNEDEIFTGLVEAMVTAKDKEKRGVGMQGFQYAPGLAEFAHIINIHSARAYRSIRNVLKLPTERSNQINRARQPRFPIGIQPETFNRVITHLEALKYTGPLGLSCDDTQLLPSLRPYYDAHKKQHFLLGNTGDPMLLLEPERFAEIIKEGNITKASKLRLWCLQVPMPNIPTIIIAALAISNTLNAEQLLEYLQTLLTGFFSRGLNIVAYAADGSSLERSLQRLLELSAKKVKDIIIKHPEDGSPDIKISIPLFGDKEQPIAMIQDSQHGAKTFRNNAFSGARLLIVGNYPITYEHFRRLAMENGPLFVRDVEKVDRQDDGAATRFFSSHALEWLVKNYPNLLGPITYLFVFGELIDAYQNRHINLVERLEMAFRAYFFMEMWERFLEKAGYPKGKHFLSKEACDITRTLIHGLIKLVIIYRDIPGSYPLLPWLLSTEVCEHVFGLCRQIIPDFTLLDFYYMIPKLFVQLREAALFRRFSDGKERANGYTHTYGDIRGIDLVALSTYPSDNCINQTAKNAFQQAENLWSLLGVPPTSNTSRLPSIRSWFVESDISSDSRILDTKSESDSDYESNVGSEPPTDEDRPALQIESALEYLETIKMRSFAEEDAANNLAFAAVALTVQDSITIHELPEPTAREKREILCNEAKSIANIPEQCLPPIIAPDEPTTAVLDSSTLDILNFDNLVALRVSHERKQAKTGVRTQVRSYENTDESDRQKLLRKFNAIIKEQEERGITATVARNMRWGPGRNPSLVGNVLNAAEVASTQANKLLTKRIKVMQKYKLPRELEMACISVLTPLLSKADPSSNGSIYGFIIVDKVVMLGQIISLYSKTGGKNGKHAWVPSVTTIAAVSYIPLQVYEHMHNRHFRAIPRAVQFMQIKKFSLLPGSSFLCTLKQAPQPNLGNLEISELDYQQFSILRNRTQHIILALKEFNGRKKPEDLGDEDN